MGATNSPSSTCEKLSKRAIRSARSCPTTRPSPGCANCRNSRNCWPWSRVFSSQRDRPPEVGHALACQPAGRPAGAFSTNSRRVGWGHALPAVLLALLFSSCIRQPAGAPAERLAVLRLENLSADASIGWAGRALSEIIAVELTGAGQPRVITSANIHALDRVLGPRPTSAPGISAESSQALAAGATLLAYGDYTVRHGKLEVRLTIEDSRTFKATKVIDVSVPAGDVLGAGAALARDVSSRAVPYGTRNPQALEAYVRALEGSDVTVMEVGLGVAIAADPDFVSPYRLLAQIKAQRQDRSGAVATLDQALARGNAIPELERARLALESAELTGNPDARLSALSQVVKLDSGDSNAWRALGDSLMNRHEYRQALQSYRKASDLEPEDIALLNAMGYAAGQAGDVDGAMSALRRYAALRPNDANPLDSMGDVHLIAGHLADAGNFYLQAAKKGPNFQNNGALIKAALARLLSGDPSGANRSEEH